LKCGEGKEFYESGNLRYKGQYAKGLKNGKIEEYSDLNGKKIFEGEYCFSRKFFTF